MVALEIASKDSAMCGFAKNLRETQQVVEETLDSVIPTLCPSIQSMEDAKRLLIDIVAPEHLRDSCVDLYDLKFSDTGLSADQRFSLEGLAKARMKYEFVRLDGTLSQQQRENVINEFKQNPKVLVMLISLKVGGVGINLTVASNVFIMVYAEIVTICGKSTPPSAIKVQKMHFLLATVHESARLLPTGPLLQQCSLKHDASLGHGLLPTRLLLRSKFDP